LDFQVEGQASLAVLVVSAVLVGEVQRSKEDVKWLVEVLLADFEAQCGVFELG
jgi:hypothetical protein